VITRKSKKLYVELSERRLMRRSQDFHGLLKMLISKDSELLKLNLLFEDEIIRKANSRRVRFLQKWIK